MAFPASLFAAGSNTDAETAKFTGLLRPILFRSEFVHKRNFLEFMSYATNPKYYLSHTKQGFPIFSKKQIIFEQKYSFWETVSAQHYQYAKRANLKLASEIRANPDKWRKILSKDTIDIYSQKNFRGTVNPRLADGTPTDWHHPPGEHKLQLISRKVHDVPHTGGEKVWGGDWVKHNITNTDRIKLTGQRWAKMAILDMVISNTLLLSQGERDWRTYAVNTAAVTGAGTVAWGIESLLVCSLPLLEGHTPYFFAKHLWLCTGGPASWIATAAYIGVQYAVMAGWHKYQLEEKRRVEYMCRTSEQKFFKQTLNCKIKNNDTNLIALSQISAPAE